MSGDDPHHEVEQPEDPPAGSGDAPESARSVDLESDDSGPTREGTRSQLADDLDADRTEGDDPQDDQPGTEAPVETEPADYEDRLGGAINNADPVSLDNFHHRDGSGGEGSADTHDYAEQPTDPPAADQSQAMGDLTTSSVVLVAGVAKAFEHWLANRGGG